MVGIDHPGEIALMTRVACGRSARVSAGVALCARHKLMSTGERELCLAVIKTCRRPGGGRMALQTIVIIVVRDMVRTLHPGEVSLVARVACGWSTGVTRRVWQAFMGQYHPNWQILMPDGRLAWISDLQIFPQEWLGVRALRSPCAVLDSVSNGSVISTMDSGDVFPVTALLVREDTGGVQQFYRVITSKEHRAWQTDGVPGYVRANDVVLARERVFFGTGYHLGGWWQELGWGNRENLSAARVFFAMVLNQYPDAVFPDPDPEAECPYQLHGGVVALDRLAELDVKSGEFEHAIATLEESIRRFPKVYSDIGLAWGGVKMHIARIQWENLERPMDAIASCQEIIRRLPGEKVEGFEWNSTLDIDAENYIARIGEESDVPDDDIAMELQAVIDSSTFPVARAMARLHKAKVHERQGQYDNAARELMTAIEEDTAVDMTFYLNTYNFSIAALAELCLMHIEGRGDVEGALDACRAIARQHPRDQVGRAARSLLAEISDLADEDRNWVLALYRTLADEKPDWRAELYKHWDPGLLEEVVSTYRAHERYDEILAYRQTSCVIDSDSVVLRQWADTPANQLAILPRGTPVVTQYTRRSSRGLWVKVKTENGRIGWIRDGEAKPLSR